MKSFFDIIDNEHLFSEKITSRILTKQGIEIKVQLVFYSMWSKKLENKNSKFRCGGNKILRLRYINQCVYTVQLELGTFNLFC